MKKFLSIAMIALTAIFIAPQVSAQRFGDGRHSDNTGRVVTYVDKSVTLANTDSITPNASYSFYTITALTAAKTVGIRTTLAKKWDQVQIKFTSDTLTAGRIITFQTTSGGSTVLWTTTSGNTVTAKKSKSVVMTFIFDGTVWMEENRSIQF